jgi:TIM-barrel protein
VTSADAAPGDVPFAPPLAVASLSGQSDAEWAAAAAPFVGCALLGGIALDAESRGAAREMVRDRDREEFLPADPFAFVERQFAALADVPVRPGINVRSTTVEPVERAATICDDHGAICELNAHCRQDELCAVGCGEALLRDGDRLVEFVRAVAEAGPLASVKVRTEVPGVDLPHLAPRLAAAGADIVHVDAMDSEAMVAEIVDTLDGDAWVVANNGVRDRATVREYLDYGADAVSVGRPSDDPAVLRRVRQAVDECRGDATDIATAPGGAEP